MKNDNIACDGRCAFAVSLGGVAKAPAANPKYTVEKNGKTYGFVGLIPKLIFQAIPGSAKRADKAWAKRQN